MFVEGEIVAKSNSSISIPAEAIVNIDDKYYILTLKESNVKSYQFEKREIKIGQSNNGFVEIVDLNEIDEKSQVLIKGAYNLIKE